MKVLILVVLAGCVAGSIVGCVGALLLEAWWKDRVHAPDPELDEALRNSAGGCWGGE